MKISKELSNKIVAVNKALKRSFGSDMHVEVEVCFGDTVTLDISVGDGYDSMSTCVPFDLFERELPEIVKFVEGKATDLFIDMASE